MKKIVVKSVLFVFCFALLGCFAEGIEEDAEAQIFINDWAYSSYFSTDSPLNHNFKIDGIDLKSSWKRKVFSKYYKCNIKTGNHVLIIDDQPYPPSISFKAEPGHSYEIIVDGHKQICHEVQTDSGKKLQVVDFYSYSLKNDQEKTVSPLQPHSMPESDFEPLMINTRVSDETNQFAYNKVPFYQRREFPGLDKSALLVIDNYIAMENISGLCDDGSKVNLKNNVLSGWINFKKLFKRKLYLLPGHYTLAAKYIRGNTYSNVLTFDFDLEAGHCYIFVNEDKGSHWTPHLEDFTEKNQIRLVEQ